MPATAIVMNMFYTGLGIARSLGERGIPVLGLSARRGIYGNFTRYAKTAFCPDSRTDPEALLAYLLKMGREMDHRAVLFPTRDDDLQFVDAFRNELSRYFHLVAPESPALNACLNKWETYEWARQVGVATPKCWLVKSEQDVRRISHEITYPCVLKPLASHYWRQGNNWEIVGGRKAVPISGSDELLAEYSGIARAGKQVLLQEMVAGGDDALLIAACYLDRKSNWVAGFNTQKLVQAPEGFGTGCIVQAVDRPELFDTTARLLQKMRFTGIAEVEYKWDAAAGEYKLIEINPRPWDQHRLGHSCGIDLIYLAYCEHAGLPRPALKKKALGRKWIAEDTFVTTALSLLWRRDRKLFSLFRLAGGKRIYAIWSARDPLPFLAYFVTGFLPRLMTLGARAIWAALKARITGSRAGSRKQGRIYDRDLIKGKSHG
jgi:D-aspartate ligase